MSLYDPLLAGVFTVSGCAVSFYEAIRSRDLLQWCSPRRQSGIVTATLVVLLIWLWAMEFSQFDVFMYRKAIHIHPSSSSISSVGENFPLDPWIRLLHVTDLHLSTLEGSAPQDRALRFERLVNSTLPALDPSLLVVTGDITDANRGGWDSVQDEKEWSMYSGMMQKSPLALTGKWIDVRGNHDNFNVPSGDASFFLRHSASGSYLRNYAAGVGWKLIEEGGRKVAIVVVDTTPSSGLRKPLNFFGRLETARLESLSELLGTLRLQDPALSIVVISHYPIAMVYSDRTVSSQQSFVEVLLSARVDLYLCGHLHTMGGFGEPMERPWTMGDHVLWELELGDFKYNDRLRLLLSDGVEWFKSTGLTQRDLHPETLDQTAIVLRNVHCPEVETCSQATPVLVWLPRLGMKDDDHDPTSVLTCGRCQLRAQAPGLFAPALSTPLDAFPAWMETMPCQLRHVHHDTTDVVLIGTAVLEERPSLLANLALYTSTAHTLIPLSILGGFSVLLGYLAMYMYAGLQPLPQHRDRSIRSSALLSQILLLWLYPLGGPLIVGRLRDDAYGIAWLYGTVLWETTSHVSWHGQWYPSMEAAFLLLPRLVTIALPWTLVMLGPRRLLISLPFCSRVKVPLSHGLLLVGLVVFCISDVRVLAVAYGWTAAIFSPLGGVLGTLILLWNWKRSWGMPTRKESEKEKEKK
jgi:hypothetical protein